LVLNPPMPTELGLLTRMEEINFDFSGFEGTIPTEIGQLSKLRHLFMRGKLKPFDPTSNRISGTIPTEVGNFRLLHTFGLSDNRVSGTIPEQISGMDILYRMELQENQLSGSMPDAFGGLRKIEYWDTYGNQLTGDLPPSIMNASTMEALYVQVEQTGPLRNWFCGERIPGISNHHNDLNVPSQQAGAKYNWVIQVRDYYNMVYTTLCAEPLDPEVAFQALTGDV